MNVAELLAKWAARARLREQSGDPLGKTCRLSIQTGVRTEVYCFDGGSNWTEVSDATQRCDVEFELSEELLIEVGTLKRTPQYCEASGQMSVKGMPEDQIRFWTYFLEEDYTKSWGCEWGANLVKIGIPH